MTVTSAQSGLWSATDTWRNGCVPVAGDAVLIDMGHVVTYDVVSDEVLSCVVVHGTVTFKPDIPTRLTVGTLTVHEHGALEGTARLTFGAQTFAVRFAYHEEPSS